MKPFQFIILLLSSISVMAIEQTLEECTSDLDDETLGKEVCEIASEYVETIGQWKDIIGVAAKGNVELYKDLSDSDCSSSGYTDMFNRLNCDMLGLSRRVQFFQADILSTFISGAYDKPMTDVQKEFSYTKKNIKNMKARFWYLEYSTGLSPEASVKDNPLSKNAHYWLKIETQGDKIYTKRVSCSSDSSLTLYCPHGETGILKALKNSVFKLQHDIFMAGSSGWVR